jgi:hypothetical protein
MMADINYLELKKADWYSDQLTSKNIFSYIIFYLSDYAAGIACSVFFYLLNT